MAQTDSLPSTNKIDPVAKKRGAFRIAWVLFGAAVFFGVVYTLLAFPEFQSLILIMAGVVLLIFGFFIVRQFSNYSLRVKFIITFLLISLFSLGAMALFNNQTVTTALTQNAGTDLKKLSKSQAVAVGDMLSVQVGALKSLSISRNIENRLRLANTRFSGDSTQTLAELERLDEEWKNADADNFLFRTHLNNAVATELSVFQNVFFDHVEIFVTDAYGGLLGATNRTSDYYQADEDWWQAAYNSGKGRIYVGEPAFDESSNTFSLIIAMPIFNDDGVVIGILRSTYDLAPVSRLLEQAVVDLQDVHLDLHFANNQSFGAESMGLAELETVDPETIDQLEASIDQPYSEFIYEDELSFVSQAPVNSTTNEPAIADLKWKIIAYQDQQTALAPAQTQGRTTILLGLAVVAVSIVAAVFMAQRLSNPIIRLTRVAQQVAEGDLNSRAPVETGDEVGVLATTFNSMTDQLSDTIDTLEDRVAARTRQLEAVVQIGQRLSGILDLSDLMREVVTLTKETFGYYHVHIYLREEDTLIMAEGYGEAGTEMKRQGHNIPLAAPQSLVARAAREGDVIRVENVREDPDWLPNPLLPDTHAEMAVPVVLGLEIVGVLDVQSEKIAGLSKDDETALQALANQVAVAVRNARIFTETQEALDQAQKLQRIYTGEIWDQLSAHQTTDYEVRQPNQPPLEQISTPEVNTALQQKQTIELRIGSPGNGSGQDNDAATDMIASLATPLKLRNQIVGVLGIRDESNPNRHWTEDEIALIEAVSEQMSLAIENARLFENTQRSAWRDQMVSESTAQVWSSVEIEEVMRTAVAQLGDKLRASEVVIRLGTETELEQE